MAPTPLEAIAQTNPYFTSPLTPLDPLPYPVYFVTMNPKWQDVMTQPELLDNPEAIYQRCVKTNDIWSVQAYLDLKLRGLDVHLVSAIVPGKICVVPHYFCRPKNRMYRSYVVACSHDCPRSHLCDHRLVINESQVLEAKDHFITHRPQPNLKPRHPARGTQIRNVVYKGHDHSLYAPFKSPELIQSLNQLGMHLVTATEGNDADLMTTWADYSEADIVLAVRNNTVFDISRKPPLKLVNAWFAGCPALLGPEPAYQSIRRSTLDYIEVKTPADVIAALRQLQAQPELYVAMVENGFQRAKEYTVDSVALEWRTLLAGAIAQGYAQWLQQSPVQKQVGRPLRYVFQMIDQNRANREYQHKIHHGPRIL